MNKIFTKKYKWSFLGALIFTALPLFAESRKITIWVHGTRVASLMPIFVLSSLSSLEHKILYTPPGLHRANTINPQLYHHEIPIIISAADPQQFPLDDFYLFGWSGNLDPSDRRQAGYQLCNELVHLIKEYIKQDGYPPQITFITHSHGGNVVLNMAKSCSSQQLHDASIRAILLACPVQQETENLAKSPIFNEIYNIHSHDDIVQIMDPQGITAFSELLKDAWATKSFNPLTGFIANKAKYTWQKVTKWQNPFSEYELLSGRHFKPQENLKQARISWIGLAPWTERDFNILGKYEKRVTGIKNALQKILAIKNRGLVHMEFEFPLFLERLAETLSLIDQLAPYKKATDKDPDVVIRLK